MLAARRDLMDSPRLIDLPWAASPCPPVPSAFESVNPLQRDFVTPVFFDLHSALGGRLDEQMGRLRPERGCDLTEFVGHDGRGDWLTTRRGQGNWLSPGSTHFPLWVPTRVTVDTLTLVRALPEGANSGGAPQPR